MERIFYSAGLVDEILGHPIYIFDTTYLPHESEIDYDDLISVLTDSLPDFPHVVVMFSGGLNRIGWIWGVKFIRSFLVDELHVRNLSRLYTVHELWFLKSITQFFSNIISTKASFGRLNSLVDAFSSPISTPLTRCSTIAELSKYMPVFSLKISLNVYRYDALLASAPWSMRVVPLVNPSTDFDPETSPLFYNHFYNLFGIISTYGPCAKSIFLKPGNKSCTDILYDCINRNQLIWINDWDLYCIGGAFKRILQNLPIPLIDHEMIPLPMQDSLDYTHETLDRLITSHESQGHAGYAQVLLQLFDMCCHIVEQPHITLHTPSSISKNLAHCISQQPFSSQVKAPVQMVTRLLTNIITQWRKIETDYDFPSIDECLAVRSVPKSCNTLEGKDDSYAQEVRGFDSNPPQVLESGTERSATPNETYVHEGTNSNGKTHEIENMAARCVEKLSISQCQHTGDVYEPLNEQIKKISDRTGAARSSIDSTWTQNLATEDDMEGISIAGIPCGENAPYMDNSATVIDETGKDSLPMLPYLPQTPTGLDETRDPLSHLMKENNSDSTLQGNGLLFTHTPKSTASSREPHVAPQWPPHKYKFLIERKNPKPRPESPTVAKLKPVTVRGRKVGELTRLFEERALGLEIIRGMKELYPNDKANTTYD